MHRRRYLALVCAGLVAGCGSERDPPAATPAATPTPTETDTETPTATATETETPTEELTGEERAAAEIDVARQRVETAYEVYRDHAGDDAESLLDVGPDTRPFYGDRLRTLCTQAGDRLATARETASIAQEPEIARLQEAADWLSAATDVQDAENTVAASLERARRTATSDAPVETIGSHLDSAREGIEEVELAFDELSSPDRNIFDATPAIVGEEMAAKYRTFREEVAGLETMAGLIDDTIGPADDAGQAEEDTQSTEETPSEAETDGGSEDEVPFEGSLGALAEAEAALEADDLTRARNRAGPAVEGLTDVEGRIDRIEGDSLASLVEKFQTAITAMRERAEALQEEL